jgi:hypothetical protein
MSNLTPEVRTDKNGNAVTRWMRSLGKKRQPAAPPAPVATRETPVSIPHYKQVSIELWGILHPMNGYDHSSRLAANIEVISRIDPVLLQRITQSARDNDFDRNHWTDRLHLSDNLNHSDHAKLEEELSAFRTALDVNVILHHLTDHGIAISEQSPHLYQTTVSLLLNDGVIQNPSSELIQALTVIAYIKGQGNAAPWKKGPNEVSDIYNSLEADVAYIVDHLDQVVTLLPELISRGTHDHNIIDMLLSSNAQALREGEL